MNSLKLLHTLDDFPARILRYFEHIKRVKCDLNIGKLIVLTKH